LANRLVPNIRSVAVIAFACTVLFDTSASAGESWIIQVAAGTVSKEVPTRGWISVVSGERIRPGTRLRTGPAPRAVLLDGDDSVTISPNASFELPHEGNSKTDTTIFQTLGTLLFKVEKSQVGITG
jgi:hypothetical protein